MTAFLIIGAVGALFLVISVLLDGLFDSFFEGIEFGDGYLSGPALFGFLTALGFGGALAMSAGLSTGGATVAGIAAGGAMGALAGFVTRSAMNMRTDATPTTGALEGLEGVVITAIPVDGSGEITVRMGGQPVKLAARCPQAPVASGTAVVVDRALSPTLVVVEVVS